MIYVKSAAVVLFFILAGTCFARDPIALLPDTAELKGVTVDKSQVESREKPFLTGFTNGPERAVFNFEAAGGLYKVQLSYRAGGFKGYVLEINGLKYGASLAKTGDEFTAGAPVLVLLKEGKNTLSVGGGWGHYDIERIDLLPTTLPPPPRVPTSGLCDSEATPEARALWAKLIAGYGKTTLSGVYADSDVTYVQDKIGKTPAILGADLSDYSTSRVAHGTKPKGTAEHLIEQARTGLILTLSWHWNAPTGLVDNEGKTESLPPGKRWYMGFNTEATTFDFSTALANEKSEEYQMLLRDIDAVAAPLQILQAAHVPILWRPLHEAEGGWFWWGSKGSKNYVKLWRLVYDRLTRVHHIHNLIWVFTAGQDQTWYPGDDVVDIVGVDQYPKDNRDPIVSDYQTVLKQFGNRKMLTLSEIGFVPDLDFARQHGVYWAYYNTWNGDLGPTNLPVDELKRRFDSKIMLAK